MARKGDVGSGETNMRNPAKIGIALAAALLVAGAAALAADDLRAPPALGPGDCRAYVEPTHPWSPSSGGVTATECAPGEPAPDR
ncbi:MAG TPA: hypothetical protein VM889_06875 [Candidatus Thermoplasmatota archaeon]|nr:hypothetical protein [Candidatus Thermoplasmatota archaeon]